MTVVINVPPEEAAKAIWRGELRQRRTLVNTGKGQFGDVTPPGFTRDQWKNFVDKLLTEEEQFQKKYGEKP